MNEVETFIRQTAQELGMDPEVAMRVVMGEGGVSDPFQQSLAIDKKTGQRERSYGPLQLYLDGGVGNRAVAAGFDPRKDWKGAARFGLETAQKEGWGQWYGAAKEGVGNWDGIKGGRPMPRQYSLAKPAPSTIDPRAARGPQEAAGGGRGSDTPFIPGGGPRGPLEAAGGGRVDPQPPQPTGAFTARPGGPVEAAGGGMGNEAGPSPIVADEDDEKGNIFLSALSEMKNPFGDLKGLPPAPGSPGAARIDAPGEQPFINPQLAETQRQMLAQAMARLNGQRMF